MLLEPDGPHFANDLASGARELHLDGSATHLAMNIISFVVKFRENYANSRRMRRGLKVEHYASEVLESTAWTQYSRYDAEIQIHAISIAAGFQLEDARAHLSQLSGRRQRLPPAQPVLPKEQ